ncbi:MAG TPA: glycosyltransferase family 2 protein [Gemmataceae bacterium]|nr:glycosyltransferase family 2 protein [Gemmataceae bacterium]
MDLSIIVPIKDERDNIIPLHDRVRQSLDCTRLDYELILVDDGSIDGSFAEMERLAHIDPRVRVVRLRRNFGQSAAMQAGIDHGTGDVIATMDGDLQNDPEDIPMLLDRLNEGYDAVFGERAKRQDGFLIRKIPSYCGNWLIRYVTGVTVKDMGCTLRVMRRDLAECLTIYGEMHRFIPVLAQQAGARMLQVPVKHHPRRAGKTKYNITRTFRVVLDLITVKFLHTYVTRPMHAMGFAGMVSIGLGFVSLLTTIVMKWQYGTYMTGNPFLLLSAMLGLIGVQFISQGLLGEMLTRTYFESQGKPSYSVRTVLNLELRERRRAA